MTEKELPSSELGTKEYWDNTYLNENDNFDEHGLEGEVWFGEESLDRILKWRVRNKDVIPTSYSILDIGCGNGQAAIELSAQGFKDVTGIDYSEAAVELASKVSKQRKEQHLVFKKCDILSNMSEIKQYLGRDSFDVCFDKGTYDAISLCPDNATSKRQKYIENIAEILGPPEDKRKFLILTSCNWTENELVEQFQERFVVYAVIPTPQFKFGGVVGNVVTSLIFEKRNS